ncbi:MAG TPA: Gfo/Idh/MocA family oxidoreductase [Gaiellaceae bacterium]|nr:Gfo/Idh/MocA family oxidoreductase [Gaiellaceae bacterium]
MANPVQNVQKAHSVTMLGTGLIGTFYTATLHGQRNRDRVGVVYSRSEERGRTFSEEWGIPVWSTDLREAIEHPDTDTVVLGLPNDLHEEAVRIAAEAGKAILSTKPLARTGAEAKRILDLVERHGVFHGYLEDLCYTPKTLKAVASVQEGAIGDVLWVRSRETHPGPHSAWFWDAAQAGGGPIVDLGCHCIEIIRSFVGKGNRPVEVMCHADTLVHPIEAEDNAIALIKFESGAVGQFEVSWTFRGGMDLRDEVAGTEGTIWLNHFLRTGFDLFTLGGTGEYVAEKAESASGWLFPVGDEVAELGYVDMFTDMFDAIDQGREPRETFYDGYVVNSIIDACYRSAASRRWEPVELEWRGGVAEPIRKAPETFDGHVVIKREKLPDGRAKLILKHPETGAFEDRVVAG